jgi:hypothetical protein
VSQYDHNLGGNQGKNYGETKSKREMVVINAKLALKLEKNKEYANLMTHLLCESSQRIFKS